MKQNIFVLFLILALCIASSYYAYKTHEKVMEISEMFESVTVVDTAAVPGDEVTVIEEESSESFLESLLSGNKKSKKQVKPVIEVSATYRLEDRYVIGNVRFPEYIGDQTGTITVNISVDKWGHVKKTSIAPGTDITDEEVIESVRRAALKTDFNSNSDAQETSKGTITYTFNTK